MSCHIFQKRHGLTLVEVMIALTVFSIGILAVASMQIAGMQAVSSAQKGMYDSVAAGKQIEEILLHSFDDAMLVDPDGGYSPDSPDHGPFTVPASRSTIEWEVEDDFPAPGTKRIGVTVRSPGKGGTIRTFTYEYVKAKDFR